MKLKIPTMRIAALCATVFLTTSVATQTFASTLTNALVAYWPLDNSVSCNSQTPDVWGGYNMKVVFGGGTAAGPALTNFNANIYFTNDAVRGNSVYVDNSGPVQMSLMFQSVNTNDLVPVNRLSANSNTVSFWIKTTNLHPAPNNDQRAFCESDYIRTYASVFDFSPVGSTYDVFVRQTPPGGATPLGNFSGGNHNSGTLTCADGTWHNVTIEAQPDSSGTNSGYWVVYVDANQDTGFGTSGLLTKPTGTWKLDTVALFCLERNGAAGFLTNTLIDDVAEWARPLTTNEILDYMANGITNATTVANPLTISSFASDLYAVTAGGSANLSWQVSSDATGISIDNGVGSVLGLSTCGVGSTSVTVSATTTYHLIVTRGALSVTNALTIYTQSGVASGWNYVGGFNELPTGTLFNQGNWQSILSSPQTQGAYSLAQVLNTVTGNHVLGVSGPQLLSAGFFGHNMILTGTTNTLFFRFYIDGNIGTNDNTLGGIPDVDINIGASDFLNLRDIVDFTGTPPNQTLGAGPGPAVRIFRAAGGVGGPIDLTANYINSSGSYANYSYVSSVDANGLATNTVYNVWIDISNTTNNPADPNAGGQGTASYYSVTLQKGGDAGTVIPYIPTYVPSDRVTNSAAISINETFVAANITAGQSTNNFVRLDDFYVSSGTVANHTIPIPQGSFVVGNPTYPTSINITSVTHAPGSVTVNWSAAGTYTSSFSVYKSSTLSASFPSGWTQIASGISGTTYTDNSASGSQAFYRVTSP